MNSVIRMSQGMVLVLTFVMVSPHVHGQTLNKTEQERADSNLTMRDGKSLEDIGVTPDEIVLPTADDLAQNRDPLLSRAASLLGKQITPDEAYKLLRQKTQEQR